MRYFKDNNNNIFAYNDNVKQEIIKPGLIEITTDEYESFKTFGVFDKTPKDVEAEMQERKEAKELKKAYSSLEKLCDDKTRELKYIVDGIRITLEQYERYEMKYELAKSTSKKAKDALADEAKHRGLTVDELRSLIKKKHNEHLDNIKYNIMKIETFRFLVKKLIVAKDLETATKLIKNFKLV